MTREDIDVKLELIRSNLDRLAQLPQGSFEDFCADFRTLDSALHRLQTTIQGLIDLGGVVCARFALPPPATSRDILTALEQATLLPPGAADRFGPMFAFRNRIVHLYDRIDPAIVYRLLCNERGDLRELLEHLLAALERPAPNGSGPYR